MDFFKSVFAEELDSPEPNPGSSETGEERRSDSSSSDPDTPTKQHESSPDPEPEAESSSLWSFGGLIKTLTVKSESVIETYRRDLQEFGTGLKKEIEVAQGSLETVSHAIDEIGSNVIKGTAQIISHGKEVILSADLESDSSDGNQRRSFDSKRYNRFDAQIQAIQGDVGTYCEEPEDLNDYRKWESEFGLEEKEEEMESLLKENEAVESFYKRVVPGSVDHQTFWCRYFYKVHKLKQTEELRAKLVNRAISPEEEELSWDFDDSDDDKEKDGKDSLVLKENREIGKKTSDDVVVAGEKVEGITSTDAEGADMVPKDDLLKKETLAGTDDEQLAKEENVDGKSKIESTKVIDDNAGKAAVESSTKPAHEEKVPSEKSSGGNKEDAESSPDEKAMISEEKSESSKGSDFSVVSSQPSMAEEEDLGWDEIEDLSGIGDDKKTTRGGSPDIADLRKRLSVAEEEEDLSWDIEDDDEPVKA